MATGYVARGAVCMLMAIAFLRTRVRNSLSVSSGPAVGVKRRSTTVREEGGTSFRNVWAFWLSNVHTGQMY